MRILFVFTGGTIGSTLQGGLIGTDERMAHLLIEQYRQRYGLSFTYDSVTPYLALSEESTGDTLRVLCDCVRSYLDRGYDGIVVAHGTDTLQYTAAALSYACADAKLPICVVSANYPLQDPRSNGLANLHGAIRFIAECGTPGVFVSYQNTGEPLRIHRGTRLLASAAFSDGVYSILDAYLGTFLEGQPFLKNPDYREREDGSAPIGADSLSADCKDILRLCPYPGNPYPTLGPEVQYVLHETYHSGTLNLTAPCARRFFEQASTAGVRVFLTGVSREHAYESTKDFERLGLVPLVGIAPIAAYIKLWMLSTANAGREITQADLLTPLAGDIVI